MQIVAAKLSGAKCLALCTFPVGIVLVASFIALKYVAESREGVGYNNGLTTGKWEVYSMLKEYADMQSDCDRFSGAEALTPVVEVKSEALYIVEQEDGGYLFCEFN